MASESVYLYFEHLFFNEKNRLRSGWRVALFLVLFFLFFEALVGFSVFVLTNLPVGFGAGSLLAMSLVSFTGLILALFLGWLGGRLLEGLPFRALGASFTKNCLKDLIWGLLIGAGSLAFAVLIAVIFGGYGFRVNESAGGTAILLTLGASFIVFALGAAFEEALVRGYIFQTLTRADLAWFAVALTSLFFAAGHLGNPGSNYFSTVNTALAGIWLGLAYLKTRTLWLVFGIHFAWNWVQGAIFGIEVSGLTDITTAPVLREIDAGSHFFSGGVYGIEGGVACTISLLCSIAFIYFVPFSKPSEEMLALSDNEIPAENREIKSSKIKNSKTENSVKKNSKTENS